METIAYTEILLEVKSFKERSQRINLYLASKEEIKAIGENLLITFLNFILTKIAWFVQFINNELKTDQLKLTIGENRVDSFLHSKESLHQLILQEKMEALGKMTEGIAHEIRNPLNFVNNFAEVSVSLAEELKEELKKYKSTIQSQDYQFILEILQDLICNAETIHQNGQRADGVVKGMIDHTNDVEGEWTKTNISQLLFSQTRFAINSYESNLENFQITIEKELQNDIPLAVINPQQMGQVMNHVVNNACYALEQKAEAYGKGFVPKIHISTKVVDADIEIRIRDNGTGIPTDIQRDIFMPFFTTKPTGFGNTGLGLFLSYDVVTQGHQGMMSCESEKGNFSEFVITLPLNK